MAMRRKPIVVVLGAAIGLEDHAADKGVEGGAGGDEAVVEAAGLTVADIVKTTVFVKNMDDFGKVNAVYGKFFDEFKAPYPARSCVEVARLPKDAGVEIEAIALRK